MNTRILYTDKNPSKSAVLKIRESMATFRLETHLCPNAVYVCVADAYLSGIDGARIIPDAGILPGTFWVCCLEDG